jgi:hypothetical protein
MSPQHTRFPASATGSATPNHCSHEGGEPARDMRSMANMFWGDEMGEVMPPRLLASAMPVCVCVRGVRSEE